MKTAEQKERLRRKAAGLPRVNAPHLLARFLALPQVAEANTVMLFCGVGREPDTAPLIAQLLQQGKRVALPVCTRNRGMIARLLTSLDELEPNRFGIPEPVESCPIVDKSEIDVVLVPNLMCDRAGYRLGHGGGYYDRWLADFHGFTAALCPAERLADGLPHDGFDIPVHLVITD